jgi:hypothetical protein
MTSSKSSSLSVAAIPPRGQDSPILEDQPKEIQKTSRAPATIPVISAEPKSPAISASDQSIDLQHLEKKQLMTAAIKKKRPRSTTSEPASCCLECSIMMPVQYGPGDLKYTSSVRCYYCNSASKRQRIDDGAHDLHIIDYPKKTRHSPHSSRYLSLQQHQCRHEHTDIKRTEILY